MLKNANNLVKKARYQLIFERLVTVSLFTILVILGPNNIIGLSMIIVNSIFLILLSALKYRGFLLSVKSALKGYKLALVWLLAFLLWYALAAGILSEFISIISAYILGTSITIYQFINIRQENIETKCNTQSES